MKLTTTQKILKKPVKARKANWTINTSTEFHWRIHLKFFPLRNARINRNLLMRTAQCYLHSFYHAFSKRRQKKQSKRSNHYIPPTLHKDQLFVVLLHIGYNDTNSRTKDKISTGKLTGDIINIGKSCIDLGEKEVVISSILPKKNIVLHVLYGRWTIA